MTESKVWLITGSSRGMGTEFARRALEVGHRVIATGRNADRVRDALGEHENLLPVSLDATDPASIETAVQSGIDRFGRIDVLLNNAGNFQTGFFEQLTDAQIRGEMDTNFFGALNVTRAVLPLLRAQGSGQIVTVTSTAGVVGYPFGSAYAASKFALEGWMEALHAEVEPFGITTTIVEPGMFRTKLLTEGESTLWPELTIDVYTEQTEQLKGMWRNLDGKQPGDPAKLATSLVQILDLPEPPERWVAGDDSIEGVIQKGKQLITQANAHPELSRNLSHA
ncbi:SDR family oxidoreductase [Rathayibacter sp. VKM Ac-2835]|uniref:SDR family oxidoreductase n=1 Tax=Rathayibacter sp. VKM Ac-2835 TaxID=2739043 RepID=UPI001563624D|nr:SDR family oxidoreductase [Rathayibacter sp. VKM Ac-2835]NRG42633.1 SDR family oxidoreductase [Rathayibacter sp. VKM Ac-2835]